MRDPYEIAGHSIPAGTRRGLEIPVSALPSGQEISLAVTVLHGRRPGPRVWLTGAIHGDEIIGVEIIRRILHRLRPSRLAGTLVAVPIVNVFGFVEQSRYLPDRRDLNRSFPGSPRGSLAARLAHLLVEHVVRGCEYGIDLHTAAIHRTNLPQLRADMDDPEVARLARAFGPPAILHAKLRDGSLRAAAKELGVKVLLYEAGEASRFDDRALDIGELGVLRVLAELGMLGGELTPQPDPPEPFIARTSRWIRASHGGIARVVVELGELVAPGRIVAELVNPLAGKVYFLRSKHEGMVVGMATHPLVYKGDAVVHLAQV